MKSKFTKIFLLFFIYFVGLFLIYFFDYKSNLNQHIEQQKNYVILQKKSILAQMESMLEDLNFIAQEDDLIQYLKMPRSATLKKLKVNLYNFSKNHSKSYFQVRILDDRGKEIIRIDKSSGKISLVPDEKLQDKFDSSYFKMIQEQESNNYSIFISPINLNIEHNAIQTPFRPTLRVIKKVVDEDKSRTLFVVLNFFAESFLSSLSHPNLNIIGDVFVLNEGNYWLLDLKNKREWGHIVSDRKNLKFDLLYPKTAAKLQKTNVSISQEGLFYSESISIFDFESEQLKSAATQTIYWPEKWLIVYEIPHQAFGFGVYHLKYYLGFFSIGIFVLFLMAYFYIKENIRKQDEQRLTQTILDTSSSSIITINQFGIIKRINSAAKGMFLCRDIDVLEKNINILMPEPYASHHNKYLQRYRESGRSNIVGGITLREVPAQRLNGETFPAEIRINEVILNGEKYFVGVLRDLTEEKSYIEKTIAAEREALIKDRFMTLLSHDLRTPLSNIRDMCAVLLEDQMDQQNKTTIGLLRSIYNSSQNSLDLVTGLLHSQRAHKGDIAIKHEEVVLNRVIQMISDSYQHQFQQKGIKLKVQVPKTPLSIDGDKLLITQVISNLLSNSFKFCEPGSEIQIMLSTKRESHIWISVSDNGPGITQEIIENIFSNDVVTTSKGTQNESGTGFGLPFCYDIVKAHRGNLVLHSHPGEGTKIDIILPSM